MKSSYTQNMYCMCNVTMIVCLVLAQLVTNAGLHYANPSCTYVCKLQPKDSFMGWMRQGTEEKKVIIIQKV